VSTNRVKDFIIIIEYSERNENGLWSEKRYALHNLWLKKKEFYVIINGYTNDIHYYRLFETFDRIGSDSIEKNMGGTNDVLFFLQVYVRKVQIKRHLIFQ
jgi:hypothetical protein